MKEAGFRSSLAPITEYLESLSLLPPNTMSASCTPSCGPQERATAPLRNRNSYHSNAASKGAVWPTCANLGPARPRELDRVEETWADDENFVPNSVSAESQRVSALNATAAEHEATAGGGRNAHSWHAVAHGAQHTKYTRTAYTEFG